ncbi:MAG: hypothetical protein HYS27_00275 [Deltaproteobacteria bacterium]|nr:hypothetical protein [Deltaproteobacteria bacterium]
MLTIAFALALTSTAPAGHQHVDAVTLGDHRAALAVAQDTGGAKTDKPAEKSGTVKKPAAKGKEMDFMERYFPFGINDGAAEPVQKNFMFVHLLGCLPLGGLWAPLLLYPSEGRPELGSDQLISYLIPFAITWGAVVGIWVVAVIPSIIIPFCGFIGCIGCPIGVAGWWVSNNASMNAWDRAYKGKSITALPPESRPSAAVAMAY